MTRRVALAVSAWNRPDYFHAVLNSYREADLTGVDVFFFIDGPIPTSAAVPAQIDQVEAQAVEFAGRANVFRREKNVGVPHQIYEAKRKLFDEMGYDLVISAVDDVVIAPYAVPAVLALYERLAARPSGKPFTADIYNTLVASREDKARQLGEIRVNGSMVFYAMGRDVWSKIGPVLSEYCSRFIQPLIDAGHPRPYKKRPHRAIRAWFSELKGVEIPPTFASSQDGCVRIAMDINGIEPWTTVVNHCANIGVNGEHCNIGVYRKLKFDQMNLDLFDRDEVLAALGPRLP
jgi:hypothetical protein